MSQPIEEMARRCAHAIREGHVTAVFTGFGWTFLCDAGNKNAVNKLKDIMGTIDDNFVIILLDDTGKLNRYLKEIPESAPDLMEFSQKPLVTWFAGVLNVIPEVVDETGAAPFLYTTDEILKQTVYRSGKPVLAGFCSDNTIQPEQALSAADSVIPLQRRRTEPFIPSIVRFEPDGSFRIIRK